MTVAQYGTAHGGLSSEIPVIDSATSVDSANAEKEYRKRGRKALFGAIFGFYVDMYDVYLPVIALAPAIHYFVSRDATSTEVATVFGLIFAVSLVGRPLGALIFGVLGDKWGRRRTTILVAAGFTICTGLIALLPGYETWGVWCLVALITLRLLDGVFLGGEYTAANPLAMEYAPPARRGLYGALINSGMPAALFSITLITMAVMAIAGDKDAYQTWGWRIPFVIGFFLSLWVFVYYLRSVPESEVWTKIETKGGNPLRELFSKKHLGSLGICFLVGTGAWLTQNGTLGSFPGHFNHLGADSTNINITVLTAALSCVLLFPFLGAAAQRFGRGRVLTVIGVLNILITPFLYGISIANWNHPALMITTASVAFISTLSIWAVVTAFIIEMFPSNIRSTGYGVAYSMPSLLPAFYTYYMVGLGRIMPYDYTPLVFIVVGGVCILIGANLAKDLRHTSLD